jgi:hypothetical protein
VTRWGPCCSPEGTRAIGWSAMGLSFAFGTLILVLLLLRQTRIRPVPRYFAARLPLFVGVIGLFEFFAYTGSHHHITGTDYEWVLGTLVIGGVLLGAIRGLTVRLWASNGWVVRQGTPATMVLWAVSLAAHFFVDGGGGHAGVSGLAQASLLLYVALTVAAQSYVVYRRALPLWQELGPEAGHPLQFLFGSTPGGMSTFFTNFGGNPPGYGDGAPGADHRGRSDVIDVDVVDDHDPPELPRSR